jgi:hypothetical protein
MVFVYQVTQTCMYSCPQEKIYSNWKIAAKWKSFFSQAKLSTPIFLNDKITPVMVHSDTQIPLEIRLAKDGPKWIVKENYWMGIVAIHFVKIHIY